MGMERGGRRTDGGKRWGEAKARQAGKESEERFAFD